MIVHLDEDIFRLVKAGIKDVEARVNDAKRRKLKVGDKLIFLKRPNEDEKIEKIVKKLDYYNNFSELVEHYQMKRLYLEDCNKEEYLQLMSRFYSAEEQEKDGVVAITFI